MSKRFKTLEEHDAELKASGKWEEYQARKAAKEAEHAARVAEIRAAAAPLLAKFRTAGFPVTSLNELKHHPTYTQRFVHLVLQELEAPHHRVVREELARSLGNPLAWGEFSKICELFARERDPAVRDGFAAALAESAPLDGLPRLMRVLQDPQHGASRVLLLRPFRKTKDPALRAAIEALADDPDLEKEIRAVFGVRKSPKR